MFLKVTISLLFCSHALNSTAVKRLRTKKAWSKQNLSAEFGHWPTFEEI